MASWDEIERVAPEFAQRVRRLFDARKHKTMATVRADGSPRISGIELSFDAGEVRFGSMPGALKGRDLHRDPRLAVHSPSVDAPDDDQAAWPGEAKIAGRAIAERDDSPPDDSSGDSFRIDINEVVLTYLADTADKLVIESWHPDRGWERRSRA